MIMSATGPSHFLMFGLVLIVAVLVQSVVVAVTYVYFTNELKQLRETYTRSNIACLIGDNLGDFFQPADLRHADSMDPCWEIKSQLQILIRKIIAKQYKPQTTEQGKLSEMLSAAFSQTQTQEHPNQVAAAHVTGNNRKTFNLREDLLTDRHAGQKIEDWKSNRQPSFLNNVEIEKGELVIKKSGFYYIYAQTYFRLQGSINTDKSKGIQLIQHIYKVTNYPDPILLMKNVKTSCWAKNAEYTLNSIYQGAIFKLNENDRIYVTVSDIDLIDMDEKGTFFGAFMLF
ncbi:tumor necrosis factor ligand superfamily member 10 [Pelodytes ibericus]